MDKKGTTSILILWLLVALLYSAAAEDKLIGVECDTTNDECTTTGTACVDDGTSTSTTKCLCDGDYVANADNSACLKKIDVNCAASECIVNAECSQTCQCLDDFTSNADKTKCLSSKGIGEVCSTTDDKCTTVGTACVDESEGASTKKCLCDGEYVANDNNDGCLKSKGIGEVCSTTDDKCTTVGTACVDESEGASTKKCLCDGEYVANDNNDGCLKKMDTSCGSTTVCVDGGVCDTTSSKCAIGSGETCEAEDSNCVSHSECTKEKCTCTNGDADESTKMCPAPSGGFRETSSMLAVTVSLWLSLF